MAEMNPNQTIRAMNDINGEVLAPNWRKYDAEELEARGLMVFRDNMWHITSAGRRFIREYEAIFREYDAI